MELHEPYHSCLEKPKIYTSKFVVGEVPFPYEKLPLPKQLSFNFLASFPSHRKEIFP
jgi:hypothetical protein